MRQNRDRLQRRIRCHAWTGFQYDESCTGGAHALAGPAVPRIRYPLRNTRMSSSHALSGLVAATYTPLHHDGRLNLDVVPLLVERLIDQRIGGLYVCGSTGEGVSLSSGERRVVCEAFVAAARGRVPVVVQVGHNSLQEACELAAHAVQAGADIISATCPSYFKIATVETLIECMAQLAAAAAPAPFYYHHIPALTGCDLDMVEFLRRGSESVPNLVGLKYTDPRLFQFQQCLELDEGRFDVVWGCDEMLLGALATGARAAVGSTYNVAAPLYQRIIESVNRGDLVTARQDQLKAVLLIRALGELPFHPAMKQLLTMQGIPVGPCRLPQPRLRDDQTRRLRALLDAIGFFEWD